MKKIKEKIRKHIEKRGKGFTLVELLAVIVILAVVILIAVTAVIPRMNSARKNAFADEALAYIKAAKEANVESQMDGSSGGTCFSIEYLNQNYIDKKSAAYEGYISYDSEDDIWKAFIKNDKYMINGEGGNLSKSNVVDTGELTYMPSTCVGAPLPICKRATILHTETCNQSDSASYCRADGFNLGDTITYGNLGTGETLTFGDALDCDVNGDGLYDAATERFYYITDMNSSTAVLLYYNNVKNGVSDTNTPASQTQYSLSDIADGPSNAVLELPTTSQWSNVNLTSTSRNIFDHEYYGHNSTILTSNFSYEGKAARLLTAQELEAGANLTLNYTTGQLSAYKFLFENTKYANSSSKDYWLETESGTTGAYHVYSSCRRAQSDHKFNYEGVRPAIEVPKSRIEL